LIVLRYPEEKMDGLAVIQDVDPFSDAPQARCTLMVVGFGTSGLREESGDTS